MLGTLAIALVSHPSSFVLTAASSVVCTLAYRSTFGRRALSRRWVALTCISLSVGIGLVVVALVQALRPVVDGDASHDDELLSA